MSRAARPDPEWVLCGAGDGGGGGGKGAGSAAPGCPRQLAAVVGPVIYMECNRSMYS